MYLLCSYPLILSYRTVILHGEGRAMITLSVNALSAARELAKAIVADHHWLRNVVAVQVVSLSHLLVSERPEALAKLPKDLLELFIEMFERTKELQKYVNALDKVLEDAAEEAAKPVAIPEPTLPTDLVHVTPAPPTSISEGDSTLPIEPAAAAGEGNN